MKRHIKRNIIIAIMLSGISAVTASASAEAAREGTPNKYNSFHGRLTGYQEDPLTVATTGQGIFQAVINERTRTITYRLNYGNLMSSATQAHLHFGGMHQSGGITAFLCSNLGNGPAGTQACPKMGTITGTIKPADVVGPAPQGIATGGFDKLVAAMRAGQVYVNVHSTTYPGGEIRAQLVP